MKKINKMYPFPVSQSYSWKQILRRRLIKTWLLGLLSLLGCFPGALVRENSNVTSSMRPVDIDTSAAEKIGQEALAKIGYNEIVNLSEKAGFVEYKSDERIQLISYGTVAATAFVRVFSRYAAVAAVTSQADSPLPGPADIAAIGAGVHTHGKISYQEIRSNHCIQVTKRAIRCEGPFSVTQQCGSISTVDCGQGGSETAGTFEQ